MLIQNSGFIFTNRNTHPPENHNFRCNAFELSYMVVAILTFLFALEANAGSVTSSVSASFPQIDGCYHCGKERGQPVYSQPFYIQGDGIVTRDGYYTSNGSASTGLDWGRIDGTWYNINGGWPPGPYKDGSTIHFSSKDYVRFGSADGARLAVFPGQWNFGDGTFWQPQQAGSAYLVWTSNPSTITVNPELAGGQKANPLSAHVPAQSDCKTGLPSYTVNTSIANLVITDIDFGCDSHGLDESLRRTWNMAPDKKGMFGNGWTFAYESFVLARVNNTEDVSITFGTGQVIDYRFVKSQENGNVLDVTYARKTPGLGPELNATFINGLSGAGSFLLYDRSKKLSSLYERVDGTIAPANGAYRYQLTEMSDRNNNKILLTYDSTGNLKTITDSSGRQTQLTYDANQLATKMSTFDGRSASYQYDVKGNLIQSIDLAGNVITYSYDDQNYPLTMTVAGKTTTFAYDTSGWFRYVASVTEPNGKIRRYERWSDGTTHVIEPGGAITVYANTNGRTTSVKDALDQTTTTIYNDKLLPTTITDPKGKTTRFDYDVDGNLTSVTDSDNQVTRFRYDSNWNLTEIENALGEKSTYSYDIKNNLTNETSPSGLTTSFIVNSKGDITQTTQPDGRKYAMGYDSHGNLINITDPLGKTTTIGFDGEGLNPTSTTDALGNSTGYSFDANRRLTTINQADGTKIAFNRDCCSLTSLQDGADNTTTFERDNLYNPTVITNALGQKTTLAYNDDSDLIKVTDPLGHAVSTGYDKNHQPISLTDAMGGEISFARDANGNVTSLTDERGKVTTMTYDNRDLLAAIKDPLGKSVTYKRDALGRIAEIVNARGDRIAITYDAEGRITSKKYNGVTFATYAWDANGRLMSMTDSSGTKAYVRDDVGRVTRITYPDGKTAAMSYDAAGNLLTQTYPDGLVVNYTYDKLNRVASVAFAGNTLTLGYDAAGNLVSETRSNGVNSGYGYDANRQLIRVSHKKGEAVIADIIYTRNAAGLITEENGTWPLDPQRTFDSVTATHDDSNAIVSWNSDAYTHDADGNLTHIAGSRSFDAVYDPENRPTSITRSGSATQYVYDGLGYRVRGQTASLTRQYYHDAAGQLLTDIDTTGNVVTHHLYADGRLIVSGSAGKGYAFYHADKTGNTLALTDTTGQVVGAFAYDDYGKVVARSGSVSTPFTYVGAYGVIEGAENLFFMRNRYYDANTHRFIHKDPAGFGGGGANLYTYVGGDPINYFDPNGYWALPAILAGGAVMVVAITEVASWLSRNTVGTAADLISAKIEGKEAFEKKCKEVQREQTIIAGILDQVLGKLSFAGSIAAPQSLIVKIGLTYTLTKIASYVAQGKNISAAKESIGLVNDGLGLYADMWEIVGIIRVYTERDNNLLDWDRALPVGPRK